MQPKVQLLHSGYRKVKVEVNIDRDEPEDGSMDFEIGSDIRSHVESPDKFLVILYIKTVGDDSSSPFSISLECLGEFQVNSARQDDESEEEYHRRLASLVKINGSAMLYSSAREYLNVVSSRVLGIGHTPSLLPTVDPRQVFASQFSKKQ